MSFEQFQADRKTIDAVERNFILFGEATGYIPDEVTARFASVPWRKMRDLRNVVVHAYWQIDLGRVWDTVLQDLPPLVPLLEGILAAEGPDET